MNEFMIGKEMTKQRVNTLDLLDDRFIRMLSHEKAQE